MANYVSNYKKKILILQGREAKLRRLLAGGASESTLLKAAEVVRDARIRAERAKKAKLSPEDNPVLRRNMARLDAKIEAIRSATPEAVLAEFQWRGRKASELD